MVSVLAEYQPKKVLFDCYQVLDMPSKLGALWANLYFRPWMTKAAAKKILTAAPKDAPKAFVSSPSQETLKTEYLIKERERQFFADRYFAKPAPPEKNSQRFSEPAVLAADAKACISTPPAVLPPTESFLVDRLYELLRRRLAAEIRGGAGF